MSKITLEQVADILAEHNNIRIICHRSPDGDTIGSAYALLFALRGMGKKCCVVCSDELPKKFVYITDNAEVQEFDVEFTIAVDVADRPLLGKVFDTVTPDLVIDHHISNTLYGKQTCIIDSASNCENIYNLIKIMNVEIDKHIADALYTGVATDTGCFMFSNVTSQTHIIAADLINKGADFAEINRVMFETKTVSRLKVERYAYDNIHIFADGKAAILCIPHSVCKEANAMPEDLEGINALTRKIEGVILGITVREQEDGSNRVSVRTHAPVDASAFCKNFGGGGHVRAGGCGFDCTIDEAKDLLMAKALDVLK